MMPSVGALAGVLGPDFWCAGFPTHAAALEHACRRMDEGRKAVAWLAGGRAFCAWGVVS